MRGWWGGGDENGKFGWGGNVKAEEMSTWGIDGVMQEVRWKG